ncbi:Glycosyl hydrolase family 3 C-terminal domain-containing protein 8 [Elsinoe fawcettii]|nr:Glycosyl hydrolase family 3 C-terminal domain-containing protein 8 [Elsinoe fawcettii]
MATQTSIMELSPPVTPPLGPLEEAHKSQLPVTQQSESLVRAKPTSPRYLALRDLLTLKEKIRLLSGTSFTSTAAIPRLGVPALKVSDSISGVRGSLSHLEDKGTACFPSSTCLAATWNKDLLSRFGARVGVEAKHKSVQVILGPNINLHRDPRGGRNFETFSEDPLLTGQLSACIVNGIQSVGVGACVKHFIANECETQRRIYDVAESDNSRTMRELYMSAFQHMLRDSQPVSIMMAYNRLNGRFCSDSPIIKSVLRDSWTYDGCVMSDWYGTHSVGALTSGLDLEMPGPSVHRGNRLIKAIGDGDINMADVDEAVDRVLTMIDRTTTSHSDLEERTIISEETNIMARQVASEGMVLLKNDHSTLPLDMRTAPKIAVIGDPAINPTISGGGSACAQPQYLQRPFDCIKAAHPLSNMVKYAAGVNPKHCIPMLSSSMLHLPGNARGVLVEYFNSANTDAVFSEVLKIPQVVMLGRLKPGLNQSGFHYRMTTYIVPETSGLHTIGVQVTGAFSLRCDGTVILTGEAPDITVEDFLFVPKRLERSTPISMVAGQEYHLQLVVQSRDVTSATGEISPHAAKLCYLEQYDDDLAIKEACDLAIASDISIVYAGRTHEHESEGFDLTTLELPATQVEMIRSVAAVSKKTVLILHGGNPIDVSSFIDEVDAVLFAHFPGQEGGQAVADIITGKANPSGRLATSWPWRLDETCVPTYKNFPVTQEARGPVIRYEEGLEIGYRHRSAESMYRYPFGYGLSYSRFTYRDLSISRPLEESQQYGEKKLVVHITVGCDGPFPGAEVVQVFSSALTDEKFWRPAKELKGFTKVFLLPGEERSVSIGIPLKDIAGNLCRLFGTGGTFA